MNRADLGPLRVLWAYRLWIVAVAVIAGVTAWYLSNGRDEVYAASAAVQIVSGRQLNGEFVGQQELVQLTNISANLAQTGPVVDEAYANAADELDLAVREIAGSVDVTAQPNLQLIHFGARSTSPGVAAALANGHAEAFADFVEERAAGDRTDALDRIQTRIDELEEDDAATSQAELQALQESAANLLVRAQDTARTIQPASTPGAPVEPKPVRDGVLAGLAALVFASVAAALADRRRDRYASAEDASEDLRLPVLGELPRLPATDPAALEAIRSVRTSVAFAFQSVNRPLLLTTSATPRAGKTYLSTALARAFAAEGNQVVTIDGDLRRPALHERLGLPLTPGIGDLVASDTTASHELTAQVVAVDPAITARGGRLDAVTAGRHVPDPAEALGGETMQRALATLRVEYDIVILDSPPVLAVADPVVLSRYADGVLVVVGGRERRADIRRTVATLRAVDANLLGIVFNSSSKKGANYSYYGSTREDEQFHRSNAVARPA